MARLKPINPATCPACGSHKTKRFGYSKLKQGSIWVCECKKSFLVPLIVMAPARKTG